MSLCSWNECVSKLCSCTELPYANTAEASAMQASAVSLYCISIPVSQVWPGQTAFPDFTNPETILWWRDCIQSFHSTVKLDGLWIVSFVYTCTAHSLTHSLTLMSCLTSHVYTEACLVDLYSSTCFHLVFSLPRTWTNQPVLCRVQWMAVQTVTWKLHPIHQVSL